MADILWPLKKLDKLQQRFKPVAFTAAVIKKYSEDEGGKMAALITYYAFMSLFPLLLVVTSALDLFLRGNEHLQKRVIDGINEYFPVIGSQLQSSISGFNRSGLALVIGILLTIYGARGGAAMLRYAFNEIWDVPKNKRPSFPFNIPHSLLIVLVGGGGLVSAAVLSGYAAGVGNGLAFKIIPFLVSFLILVGVFYLVFSLGITSREPSRKDLLISAIATAIGVQALQLIGGYLVTHQLRNLSELYGAFAVVLGLIFWIYLQAQVLIIAAFAGVVRARKLWPRKLIG